MGEIVNEKESYENESSRYSMRISQKIALIFISSLLFGLGWFLRGSGTSDPVIPLSWYLFFVLVVFYDRVEIPYPILGWTVLLFRLGRRGWGTFVSQIGIPGVYDAILYADGFTDYVKVQWWQGFFWLFIVGVAWVGPASLFLGGLFFTGSKFEKKDYIVLGLLYVLGYLIGGYISSFLIPYISPEAYEFYINGAGSRNYKSMKDNMALSIAMIPPLLYVYLKKKDHVMVKRMCYVMLIFGFSLSISSIWHTFARYYPEKNIPGWSLWEYSSGFLMGFFMMIFYLKIPADQWRFAPNRGIAADGSPETSDSIEKNAGKKGGFFSDYLIGHVMLFIYGIQETFGGAFNRIMATLGSDVRMDTWLSFSIIMAVDLPVYLLYVKGKIFKNFRYKPMPEKSLIFLLLSVPCSFFAWMAQFLVSGDLFPTTGYGIMQWLCTLSFALIMALFLLNYVKKREHYYRNNHPE